MILRYIAYLPVNLALVGLAYLLSPLLAAVSLTTGPRLPGILQWFSTLDADLDGGIGQGVKGYRTVTGWRLWWQRTCWICRNPAHGWQSEMLGMPVFGTIIAQQWISEDHPKQQIYLMQTAAGARFFCFKRDQPLLGGFYLKIWLGWVNEAYDGRNHHYSFQIAPKRA